MTDNNEVVYWHCPECGEPTPLPEKLYIAEKLAWVNCRNCGHRFNYVIELDKKIMNMDTAPITKHYPGEPEYIRHGSLT